MWFVSDKCKQHDTCKPLLTWLRIPNQLPNLSTNSNAPENSRWTKYSGLSVGDSRWNLYEFVTFGIGKQLTSSQECGISGPRREDMERMLNQLMQQSCNSLQKVDVSNSTPEIKASTSSTIISASLFVFPQKRNTPSAVKHEETHSWPATRAVYRSSSDHNGALPETVQAHCRKRDVIASPLLDTWTLVLATGLLKAVASREQIFYDGLETAMKYL